MDRGSALGGVVAVASLVVLLSAAPAGAQDGMYTPIAPADPQYVCSLNPGLCTPPVPTCAIGAATAKKFSIGKFTAKRSGKGTLKVKVNCPGELVAADSTSKKLIKRTTRRVARGGTFTLTLNPSNGGKSRLKSRRSLGLRVKVAFKPTGGGVSEHKKNVKLKLPAKKTS